jgi:hypothetical protein
MIVAQRHKPEGQGFDSPWGNKYVMYLIIPAHHNPEVCSTSNIKEYQKIFHKMILGGEMWPASNLTANNTSIIQTMWESRCLTTQ